MTNGTTKGEVTGIDIKKIEITGEKRVGFWQILAFRIVLNNNIKVRTFKMIRPTKSSIPIK